MREAREQQKLLINVLTAALMGGAVPQPPQPQFGGIGWKTRMRPQKVLVQVLISLNSPDCVSNKHLQSPIMKRQGKHGAIPVHKIVRWLD